VKEVANIFPKIEGKRQRGCLNSFLIEQIPLGKEVSLQMKQVEEQKGKSTIEEEKKA